MVVTVSLFILVILETASLTGTTDASPATAGTLALTSTGSTEESVLTTPKPMPCRQLCTANGVCDPGSGRCVCNPGWMGDRCHLCGGKVK